jgi:hypothetical protein
VANSLLIALSSSSQTPPFWLNPVNGVELPGSDTDSAIPDRFARRAGNIPVTGSSGAAPQLLSNSRPSSADRVAITHYDIQPTIDVYAAVQGTDLGDVAGQVSKIVDEARAKLPAGVQW